jgi:SAM-dependent methyltransferase
MSDSPWNEASTVEGFVRSPSNGTLLQVAARELRVSGRLLDIRCGAGRNALPLATSGWKVIGTDASEPMLKAAAARVADAELGRRVRLVRALMHQLPLSPDSFDFIVGHGIWNLARSGREFRMAVEEAARVARTGCALFSSRSRAAPSEKRPSRCPMSPSYSQRSPVSLSASDGGPDRQRVGRVRLRVRSVASASGAQSAPQRNAPHELQSRDLRRAVPVHPLNAFQRHLDDWSLQLQAGLPEPLSATVSVISVIDAPRL